MTRRNSIISPTGMIRCLGRSYVANGMPSCSVEDRGGRGAAQMQRIANVQLD